MTATKFGLYTPVILLTSAIYLFKNKLIRLIPVIFVTTILGYIMPYVPIIISDGIINFINAQKWIVNFYLDSDVIAPIGMILVTSFTGMYKNWGSSTWETIKTWNGEWALGLLALFYYLADWIKSKKIANHELSLILLSLTGILLILLKIPFWPRYLIFFIPFFWLMILNLIKDQKFLFLLLVFPIISTSKLILFSYQPPDRHLDLYSLGAYEEIYQEFTSQEFKSEITQKNL
jgi:hypothetical protein